ncbi:MAG: WG repeat-containing protein [Clostridia bacterium]|nr:WG repeat-containing protein [Clostridia bacterium]
MHTHGFCRIRLVSAACLVIALLLTGTYSCAENADTLYPIRVDDLWGYMNRAGTVVIEPQFASAEGFRGGYAVVGLISDDPELESEYCGIIDRTGRWALEPGHLGIESRDEMDRFIGGRDEGIYIIRGDDGCGFFDIPSGFFSDLVFDDVESDPDGQVDAKLVCVQRDFRKGFARRDNGEIAVPCLYDSEYIYAFEGEYCAVMPYDTDIADDWRLIDREGKEIPMPEGCHATANASEGLVPVWNAESDLCGYADTAGNMAIEPQYQWAYPFREGRACVTLTSWQDAVITPENEIVAVLSDSVNRTGSSDAYSRGQLQLAHYSDGLEYIAFLDAYGREVFRLDVENLISAGDYFGNGTAFYQTGKSTRYGDVEDSRYGLFNEQGEILTGPVFEMSEEDLCRMFSEGCFAVTDADTGCKGFIDARGQWVIAPEWDEAEDFYGGLAPVERDGRLAYIDHDGKLVWEEK